MFGFIVAVIAGFLTPYAETPLARPVAKAMGSQIALEPGEITLLSFILVMLLAGIASELLNSGSSFWVILGGALGYFLLRIVAMIKGAIDGRKG